MPILAAEKNVWPEDLLEGDFRPDGERRWWVVHTLPRQEKAIARDLVRCGVPFYLPLVPKTSRKRGRTFTSRMPLFGSYLFIRASEDQRVQTLQTNRVAAMLPVEDQGKLFCQLQNLKRLIAADAPLTIERKLEPGRPVRIKSGPMSGTEGEVISRRGKDCLLVAVTMLQQGVSVEIEDFQVEPIY